MTQQYPSSPSSKLQIVLGLASPPLTYLIIPFYTIHYQIALQPKLPHQSILPSHIGIFYLQMDVDSCLDC